VITPEQSPIARQETIRGLNGRLAKEAFSFFISSNLSAAGLVPFILSLSEKYNHVFSPATQIGSGVIFVGGLAASLVEAARMLEIQRKVNDAYVSSPTGGNIAEIMKPLTAPLSDDEERQLIAAEAAIFRLLPSGLSGSGDVEFKAVQPDETLVAGGPRIEALKFILKELLDIRVIRANPNSYEDRNAILQQLKHIISAPPNALGLPLIRPEEHFLTTVINIGIMTEKAPDTMVAYVDLLGELIESYVLGSKIEPRGKAMADDLTTAAVRAGFFTRVAASPPLTEWRKSHDIKAKEAEKVVVTEDHVIDFAKSMVALGNNRSPEVRKAFLKILPGLKDLLVKEKDRRERIDKNPLAAATINTILYTLSLSSMEKVVDKGTLDKLNQLFGNRLSGKSRIAPRDLMDEFKNTGIGSWSIEGDRITVVARTTHLADVLACAVVICYPNIPRIEICVNEDVNVDIDTNVVNKSVMIPTGVFYSQRLIGNNGCYMRELLSGRSHEPEVSNKILGALVDHL
jgi:hypothetical protein